MTQSLEPTDIADHTLVVRFDYEVDGNPLREQWPVTKTEARRIEDFLSRYGEEASPWIEVSVNRSRRNLWINLARVREINIILEYHSRPSSPSTLEAWRELSADDGIDENDTDDPVPHDLYPLAIIAFRASDKSYGGGRWLALIELTAEDVDLLHVSMETESHLIFLGFSDDDGEMRYLRREDVAFVETAETAWDEREGVHFVAEGRG